jgi:hypothetical protein
MGCWRRLRAVVMPHVSDRQRALSRNLIEEVVRPKEGDHLRVELSGTFHEAGMTRVLQRDQSTAADPISKQGGVLERGVLAATDQQGR